MRLLSLLIATVLVTSCATYDYKSENMNHSACTNPTYICTMSKMGNDFDPTSLTLFNLLKDARAAHGNDVTIQNIRYDLQNGKKRLSVIYDVVKCK